MRTALLLFLCGVSVSGSAFAEPVFFDDFDGTSLQPHWSQPPPGHWQYTISNSMLNVDALLYPSNPHSPGNFVTLGAWNSYAPQADLQLDASMGWDQNEAIDRLALSVSVNSGGIATIGYRREEGVSSIYAATSNGLITIPAPPPGMYDFRMTRSGSRFDFFFEGVQFASLTSSYTGPLDGLHLFLASPFPGPGMSAHIDRIAIVPTPGCVVTVVVVSVMLCRRSRRVV